MLSSEYVAEKIFKILKGNGHNLKLYTDEGDDTVDPSAARRFFLTNTGTMVNLDETDNRREIKVSLGQSANYADLKDTLYQIKNLANRSIIEYTLKQYAKQIEPKDFDYQAQKARDMNTVNEAIGAAYGSSKSSYQKLESARLVIKHNKPVNEDQRGSRSRNISAIYIENAEGERYRLPSNNLAGGRAMLRHVKEGGTPYDDFGKYIVEQCNELKKLKEFKRYSEKNGLVNEDTADIMEAVVSRISSIRESLDKMKGGRSYAAMLEAFESKDEQLDEISKSTLGRYATKALNRGDMANRMSKSDDDGMGKIAGKRLAGVKKAVDKLADKTGKKALARSIKKDVDTAKASGNAFARGDGVDDQGKSYYKAVRNIGKMREEVELDEDDFSDVKDKFTVQYFDENVEGALPYVQALVKEMQAVRDHNIKVQETIGKLVKCVESAKTVWVKEGIDIIGDPDNPMNHTFEDSSARAQLGAVMEYISNVLDESEGNLSNLLAEASKLVDSINDDAILGKSARAITALMPKLQPTVGKTTTHTESNKWEQHFNKFFENYNVNKIFT